MPGAPRSSHVEVVCTAAFREPLPSAEDNGVHALGVGAFALFEPSVVQTEPSEDLCNI